MSFSWFRHDAQYGKIAHGYGQGFILIPILSYAGYPYQNMEVLCAFPMDAASDERRDRGCGAHRLYPFDSGPCQSQGIDTALRWREHYQSVPIGFPRHDHQCGFTTVTRTPGSAALFALLPAIMKGLGQESFDEQNELVIEEWPVGLGATMPVEAFFYVEGSDGLTEARRAQVDFHCLSAVWRPVIRMTLPTTRNGRASFTFATIDQAVP